MGINIVGTGSAVPEDVITNDDWAQIVDTSDEWIYSRTGIKKRHVMKDDETPDEYAARAAEEAMKDANIKAEELDLIICATVRGTYITPSLACCVQKRIKARCPAFDINAACSGFLYALTVAERFISKEKRESKALVIAFEGLSRLIDRSDRNTCVLFGDGAGAAVMSFSPDAALQDAALQDAALQDAALQDAALQDAALQDAALPDAALQDAALPDAALQDAALQDAALQDAALQDAALQDAALPVPPLPHAALPVPPLPHASLPVPPLPPSPLTASLPKCVLKAAGDWESLYINNGGANKDSVIHMNGQEIFKFAVLSACRDIKEVLKEAGLKIEDVDHVVLHQANSRIIEAVAQRLGLPQVKCYTNISEYGNTSCASIPIALDEMNKKKMLQKGEIILLSAFGGGLTSAAYILRWHK